MERFRTYVTSLCCCCCFILPVAIEAQSAYDLRLYGGQNAWEGRLEIYMYADSSYIWGTVCDSGFGEPDGRVACKQLGYLFSSISTGIVREPICKNGWSNHGEYCYYVSNTRLNYENAAAACVDRGSTLASIHSEDENIFVKGLKGAAYGSAWIGLNDIAYEGNFRWIDESSVNYYNWHRGEPNGQDCVEMYNDGTWNDHAYNALRSYICKARAAIWLSDLSCSGTESRLVDCGHSNWGGTSCSHTQDVYLTCMIDSEPPEITGCPEDITTTTELGTSGTTVSWIAPTATDQVRISKTTVSHGPSTMFDIGITPVAYIFEDPSRHSATCAFFITVGTVDTTLPEIIECTDDIGTIVELGISEESVNWTEPYATDLSGTPRRSQSHVPPSEFPLGVTVVEYTFMDTSNNTATCTFSITVDTVDTTAPVPSRCPTDFNDISGRHVTWTEPTSYDVSGNVTVLQSQWPGMFLTKTTSVVYFFTDPSDNIAYCNFTINVVYDKMPPSITGCPDDIFVTTKTDQSETPVHWTEPYATDDYGRVTLIERSHRQRAYFPVGLTSVKYIFADDSYNKAFCNFSVIVEHVDATTNHSCPPDIIHDIDTGSLNTPVYWNTPRAVDLPRNASLAWHSHFSGDNFAVGKTTVKYMFVDDSGIQENCTFVITVRGVDNLAPTISNCPPDITAPNGIERPVRSWIEPFATGSTGNATLLAKTHSPGDRFVAGSTNIIYFFQDSSKNVAICSFYVMLKSVDTIPPTIEFCPEAITDTIELGLIDKTVSWSEPIAIDVSGNVSLASQSYYSGDVFMVGKTEVKYVFMDGAGNAALCTFYVTLIPVDSTPPSIMNCPFYIYTSMEMGTREITVSWNVPFAIDQSGKVTSNSSHEPGHSFPEGSTNVVYQFEDESRNRAECNFTVFVELVDTIPPTIEFCPEAITDSIELGLIDKAVAWSEPIATDVSGNVSLASQSVFSGDVLVVGKTEVKYVFIDGAGNEALCKFYVTLTPVDATPPSIINCPTHIYTSMEMGTREITVSWNVPFAIDQSGKVTSNSSHEPGHSFPEGSSHVAYQFEDESRNRAECNFTIFVELVDTMPPTIEFCPTAITDTIELGLMDKTVAWSEPIASDVSGNVSLASQSYFSGDVFMVGKTKVKYVFLDGTGNEALCKFYVTLISVDTIAPTITYCPDDIETDVDLGSLGAVVSWDEPQAEDASKVATLFIQTHISGTFFMAGTTFVTYIFRDNANNMETCSFTVTVMAVEIPGEPDVKSYTGNVRPNSGYKGLSVGGLVLSLMVVLVLLICGSIALLIYIRKRRNCSATELDSLSMSTTCSQNTASKL